MFLCYSLRNKSNSYFRKEIVKFLGAKSGDRTVGISVFPLQLYLWTKENHEGPQFR
jgi:hypothetical protein